MPSTFHLLPFFNLILKKNVRESKGIAIMDAVEGEVTHATIVLTNII